MDASKTTGIYKNLYDTDALIELSDLMNLKIEHRLKKLIESKAKTHVASECSIVKNEGNSLPNQLTECQKKIDLEKKLLNLILFRKNLLENSQSQKKETSIVNKPRVHSKDVNSDELMKKAVNLLNARKSIIEYNKSSQKSDIRIEDKSKLSKSKSLEPHTIELNKIFDKLCNLKYEKSLSNYTLIGDKCVQKSQESTNKTLTIVKSKENLNQIEANKKRRSQNVTSKTNVPNFNHLPPSIYDINKWKVFIKALTNNEFLMNYALSKSLREFSCLAELINFFKLAPTFYDAEKIWVVYVWIAENIEYDIDSLKAENIGKINPSDVFTYGKCICQGFALLFKYICQCLGFECIKISGYSKGSDVSVLKYYEGTDHAWNAVKINNRWEYVDCTWSVGYVEKSGNSIRFTKKFQPIYFLTPPQIFIYDHYSENFQLQKPRISLADFRLLPRITINFHIYEFECLNHSKGEINTSAKRLVLKFKCPKTVILSAKLKDFNGNRLDDTVYLGRNPLTKNYEIVVQINESKKKFILSMYAKYFHDESNFYDEIGKFVIQSSNMNCGENEFLVRRLNASSIESFLFYPLELNFKKLSQVKFKLYVKNALKVALVDNSTKWVYFEKSNTEEDTWHLSYFCNLCGKISLFAKTSSGSSFHGIYSYFVVN